MKYIIKISLLIVAAAVLFLVNWTPVAVWGQNVSEQDSARLANQQRLDSTKLAQKQRSDSMALVRAYKSSPQYKDSVAAIRQAQLEEMAIERTRIMDSIRGVMKFTQDSTIAANKRVMDSIRTVNDSIKTVQKTEMERQQAIRKHISDSMAVIRAYKQSKGFKDSVALVSQQRLDSLKLIRAAYNDSVRTAQRKTLDSITAERKKYNDSLRVAQKTINDSVRADRIRVADSMRTYMDSVRAEMGRVRDSATAARKVISDSLTKVREQRAKDREVAVKEKEKKKKLALEIKLDKEKKAYTNEKMRKKSFGFPRKVLQNTYTRYNYVFNAKLKLAEAELNMQRLKKDSFQHYLSLFPFNPDVDSARLKSDMDTIIQKTSLGIQLHDPRVKWQDDLYLIMGQAFYYKGDYENAANAFKYIVHQTEKDKKEKNKKNKSDKKDDLAQNSFAELEPEGLKAILQHTPAKNTAILWLARVLVKQKDFTMANLLLDMLKNDVNFPVHLKEELALEYANLALETAKYANAVPHLEQVLLAKDMDNYTRRRAGYILGQVLQASNDLPKSTKAFEQVVDLHPNLDMDFNARMNIVKNNIAASSTDEANYQTLVKMSKDDKFKPYYDQVHFALAKHYEQTGETQRAIEEYNESIHLSGDNAAQKGTSYVGLGDLFYKQSKHLLAAEKYDSAAQYLTVQDQPVYNHATNRAAILYKVATPAGIVKTADSLLDLSALSDAEQRKYIRQTIKEIEKHRLDSFYASLKPTNVVASNANNNANKAWYFGNPTAMQKGNQEFKQKWPNRELKDNWRRSVSSGGMSFTEDNAIVEENLTPEEKIKLGLPSEDSLWAAIPRMPQHLDTLKVARMEALYELGKNYFYHLEDYDNTLNAFDKLDNLYPNNRHLEETTYLRYLLFMRQQKPQNAEVYYNTLLQTYPNSNFTKMLLQAVSGGKGDGSLSLDEHYDSTYNMIMGGQYEKGLIAVEQAATQFPVLGNYRKQYDLLRVIGYAGKQEFDRALTLIDEWLKANTKDSLTAYATTIRSYILKSKVELDEIKAKQKAEEDQLKAKDNANISEEKTETQTSPEIAPESKPEEPVNSLFSQPKANAPHYVIVVLPLDNRIQGIKAGLIEYNKITAGHEQIAVTLNSLTQEKSIVLSKQFKDQADAQAYKNKINALSSLYQEYNKANEVVVTIITVDNYGKLLASKDIQAYLSYALKNYK